MSDATSSAPHGDSSPAELAATVRFYYRHKRVFATTLNMPLKVGRQRSDEPAPRCRIERVGSARIVLAPLDDLDVSRSQVELVPLAAKQNVPADAPAMAEVKNVSSTLPVRVSSDIVLKPGDSTVAEIPVLVQFSSYAIRIEQAEEENLELEPLPQRTAPPSPRAGMRVMDSRLDRLHIDPADEQLLLRWLETVMEVFQSAANSHDFPEQAAKAIVKIVGLDAAAMMECDAEGHWTTAAMHSAIKGHHGTPWMPSQTLLAQVRKHGRTYRHVPANVSDTAHSLQNVSALVAAPILDGDGKVIGALYGDRHSAKAKDSVPDITLFEAKLVEVLASGIASGIARVKEEQAAMAARVQFEQFFTPQLAAQLERDPELLEGRDAEITVLFVDIRGFSRISSRLSPKRTMAWIRDTLGALSECVLACDGVVVDYVGDELMAMWGAPVSRADHAELACQVAGEMIRALPEINARWEEELGEPVELGIGINSGMAHVGNSGSRLKFKYGPLGDAVNIASRVQGATKYLGADCLCSGAAQALLPPEVATRRLAQVQVVNIPQPMDLYELVGDPPADWKTRCSRYEEVLIALEKNSLDRASRLAILLRADYPEDRAVLAMSDRVAEAESSDDQSDTTIWPLPGK